MRKAFLSSLVIVAITASLTWAGDDVWKTKPYLQWDQKDIQMVLEDSPWVKVQRVPVTWRSGASSAVASSEGVSGDKLASLGPPSGACDPVALGGACDEDAHASMGTNSHPATEISSAEAANSIAPGSRTTPFLIRWNSAQTIREALARNALLNHRTSEADALKFVAQSPPDFQILFTGTDMFPFAGLSEEELKSGAYLEAKQSKQKVTPESLSIKRTPDNKRVILIMFLFPRRTAEKQPFITEKDKNLEFVCELKNFHLRVSFDLHKMETEKGPDL
ncbi:MAG TPA: hypothetical protein VGT03_03840 [Candidatus Acidoferrales bacterium]|nr:hypothetical protein [Candidatus Acidoferrales bacterium]